MKAVWLVLLVVAALTGACPHTPSSRKGRPPEPPRSRPSGNGFNVLLITIDTLRADHLGAYGYRRPTSPNIDALAASGALFEQAYTHWPKTRGSFVMMMTGRHASQNGYSKAHPFLLDFNPTLASTLKEAGYATAAIVDNGNVDSEYGYAKGFDRYRETWEEPALKSEMDKTRAITADALKLLSQPPEGRPFFLWLHYVNPHTPYTPPAPYDTKFLDASAETGPVLAGVESFHGGVHKMWEVPGKRLGYYIAQYDGEIAAVDEEVGRVLAALAAGPAAEKTVVLLTSDHGESLGEHDYYFDHGEDVFDPSLRVPLILRVPGGPAGVRSPGLASTLDVLPTLLDAVKVSYPPDLAGRSLLPASRGAAGPERERLFAQNDRNWSATFDARWKLVAPPQGPAGPYALYDRAADPSETRDVAASEREAFRVNRREMELYFERGDKEWAATRRLTEGEKTERAISSGACESLIALGYVQDCS